MIYDLPKIKKEMAKEYSNSTYLRIYREDDIKLYTIGHPNTNEDYLLLQRNNKPVKSDGVFSGHRCRTLFT